MADDQSRPDRVFALEDVDVCAADRRRGDADDGFADAGTRLGDRLDADVAGAVEHGRAHHRGLQRGWSAGFGECHGGPLFWVTLGGTGRAPCGQPAAHQSLWCAGTMCRPRAKGHAGPGHWLGTVGAQSGGAARHWLVGVCHPSSSVRYRKGPTDTSTSTLSRQRSRRPSRRSRGAGGRAGCIHKAAEELAGLPADRKANSIAKVLSWVDETLKPHLAWEESWLCPEIDTRAQTTWVTRLVRLITDRSLSGEPGEGTPVAPTMGLHAKRRQSYLAIYWPRDASTGRPRTQRDFLIPLLATEADRWTPEWRD